MQKSVPKNKSNKHPPSQFKGFVKRHRPPPMSNTPSSTATMNKTEVLPKIPTTPKRHSSENKENPNGPSTATTQQPTSVEAATTNGRERTTAAMAAGHPQQKQKQNSVEGAEQGREELPSEDKALERMSPSEFLPQWKEVTDVRSKNTEDNGDTETTEEAAAKSKPKKKKTSEEWQQVYESKIQKALAVLNQTRSVSVLSPDGELYSEAFLEHIRNVYLCYSSFMPLPLALRRKGQLELADSLLASGTLAVFCDSVIDVYRAGLFGSEDEAVSRNHVAVVLSNAGTLRNFSDCSDAITYALRDHPGFLEVVVKWVQELSGPHLAKELKKGLESVLHKCLSVIHNVAMRDANISRFRELNTTNVLLPMLASHQEPFKLTALASLADIVSEEEADKLVTDPGLAEFLLKRLERALKSKNHRCNGWSVTELVRAVRRLGRNDANKRLLVSLGTLPLLAKGVRSEFEDEQIGVRSEFEDEQIGCMEALWVLSFDNQSVEEIVRNEELMEHIIHCSHDRALPQPLRHSAAGILWQCRTELIKSQKYSELGKSIAMKTTGKKKGGGKRRKPKRGVGVCKFAEEEEEEDEKEEEDALGHVMLSYQWDNQEMVKQIRDVLRAKGFRVWMDIDNMGGSTLQAMAAAVEDAIVVLICMSQKYKDSSNTRAEAEYTFQQRKTIVPLIMERGYRPDGWLGMILGAKLFYDFSGKYTFESRIEGLVREVAKAAGKVKGQDVTDGKTEQGSKNAGSHGREPAMPMVPSVSSGQRAAPVHYINTEKVKGWKAEDVKSWLKKHGLNGTELERLTGNEVAFLHSLRAEAPEFFFKTLDKKLHISTLSGLMSFTEALNDLPAS